jgi:hypothetical protein
MNKYDLRELIREIVEEMINEGPYKQANKKARRAFDMQRGKESGDTHPHASDQTLGKRTGEPTADTRAVKVGRRGRQGDLDSFTRRYAPGHNRHRTLEPGAGTFPPDKPSKKINVGRSDGTKAHVQPGMRPGTGMRDVRPSSRLVSQDPLVHKMDMMNTAGNYPRTADSYKSMRAASQQMAAGNSDVGINAGQPWNARSGAAVKGTVPDAPQNPAVPPQVAQDVAKGGKVSFGRYWGPPGSDPNAGNKEGRKYLGRVSGGQWVSADQDKSTGPRMESTMPSLLDILLMSEK